MNVTETDQVLTGEENEIPKDQYLVFSIDGECFGIDINYVIEIIGMEVITVVPDLPDYIKGVINLRGKIIPVMDVLIRFQKQPKEYDERTCIIVVDIDSVYVGLIIDEVLEVLNIAGAEIIPLPKAGKDKENITNRYVWGLVRIQDMVRLLIDAKKLIEKD